ncbi:MipA/OmpV family protein [Pseudorhodoplanes sinuspersici]|nr:MipA/OmpV family protein [Pseudorhodoplanes sinuspersici]RKE73467.1 outer membrane scaffolding protein for murein synthesis (MipA/OmpV family) [Pseudorhodoplanes sinuspersici]
MLKAPLRVSSSRPKPLEEVGRGAFETKPQVENAPHPARLQTKTASAGRPHLPLLIMIAAFPPLSTFAHAADVVPPGSQSAPVAQFPTTPSLNQFAFVTEKLSQWNVVLGGGAMIAPKYEGSDEFEIKPVPFVTASYGDWLRVDPRGATVSLYSFGDLHLSAKLGYDLGRKEDKSVHLRGLGDIDPGAVVGAELAYKFGALKVFGELNRTIGGSDGLQARFGAELGYKYERWLLTAGASATWADAKYMSTYFGVTPTQSANSGLPVFDIGAGLKRVDVSASVTYAMTENWLIRAQAGYGFLVGDVANSPIVQREAQPFGMLAIGYKF